MTENARVGDIVGTISRRLLVNSWVDPAEVKPLLPEGVRPHVASSGGVVVGCCMIEIDSIRPWPIPRHLGLGVRAAAHRISVDVGPIGEPKLAVYVPVRQTDSRPTAFAGGRIFPGVHKRSLVVIDDGPQLSWNVQSEGEAGFDIAVTANVEGATEATSEVADIVLETVLGLSPGYRSGSIEAVEMLTGHRRAKIVDLEHLDSRFLQGFDSSEPTDSLLMTDVDVTWRTDRETTADLQER